MAARFLHAADIHLGFMQYNCTERFNDFGRAFFAVIDDAIARRVDFVALAGDLFNKRAIDPPTLLQATAALERLQAAGIPAIAIEGNHERSYYNEGFTWLDYLAEVDLLTLLTPIYAQGQMALAPWDARAHSGAYIDLPCGVRVIGARYAGASTGRLVQDLAGALAALPGPRPAYTVLMLHAGVQGVLDQYSGTLSRAQLEQLRPYVDYLALGHIHKPFIQDDWIYNPGSLETNSTGEVEWADRGYFVVDVEPGHVPAHHVTRVRGRRREFVRLRFEVDAWPDPEALCAQVQAYLQREANGRRRRTTAPPPTTATGNGGGVATGGHPALNHAEWTWTTSTTWPWRASPVIM